jgi:hypothetical protein
MDTRPTKLQLLGGLLLEMVEAVQKPETHHEALALASKALLLVDDETTEAQERAAMTQIEDAVRAIADHLKQQLADEE